VLPLEMIFSKRGFVILLSCSTPSQCCTCSKPGAAVKSDFTFCWYWWNCWPPLFKLSFHNCWPSLFKLSFHNCWPSLFKLSFHNCWPSLFKLSLHNCWPSLFKLSLHNCWPSLFKLSFYNCWLLNRTYKMGYVWSINSRLNMTGHIMYLYIRHSYMVK
jgi:hypothetical protein